MITLTVYVSGDHWLNPKEIHNKLLLVPPDEILELDFRAEGPSLAALGILEMLTTWCRGIGRNPDTIFLSNWANDIEMVPFTRTSGFSVSHFFWLCQKYITDILPLTHEYRFGMFIGRRTASRMRMIWDIWQDHRDQCLFSLMPSRVIYDPRISRSGVDLDGVDRWVPNNMRSEFYQWCDDPPISGIDGHTVQQQYQPEYNTNLSLLSYYHRFDIEIVVETYSMGDCFMPTEKTVRPIIGRKPMIVYGPRGYLARLRDLGFRTWSDHWDESYDDFEGPDRWQAMRSVIDQINDRDIDDTVAEHNRQYLDLLRLQSQPI